MKFNTYYQHPKTVGVRNDSPSMTDPQYKDECDVNKVLRNFERTGAIPPNTRGPGATGDYTDVGDFGELMNRYIEAKSNFEALPSDIRERFGNNPKAFYDFVNDGDNTDELVKLGLAVVRQPAEVPTVRILKEDVTPQGSESAQ